MSGGRLLLDTNVALFLLRGERAAADAIHGQDVFISFITRMELLGKPGLTKTEIRSVEAFIDEWPMVELDRGIMDAAILLRRKYSVKIPDAIIAATAQFLNVPLLTADKGFARLKDVIQLVVFEPD